MVPEYGSSIWTLHWQIYLIFKTIEASQFGPPTFADATSEPNESGFPLPLQRLFLPFDVVVHRRLGRSHH